MILIVHGGAGSRKPTKRSLEKIGESLTAGYEVLKAGGASCDAVMKSITILEDCGSFNAGTGGNLQMDGVRRLDAALMEGRNMKAGAAIGVEGLRNPIELAMILMDLPNVVFTNVGARKIAKAHGLATLPDPDAKALEKLRTDCAREKRTAALYRELFSTVGAVALDRGGSMAAGSSTGGVRAMLPGRVGDTPVVGAGVYAEDPWGAVACTGHGESILRLCLAKEICMGLREMPPLRAARRSIARLRLIGGRAGVIVINGKGRFVLLHSTPYLAAGHVSRRGITVAERFTRLL
jgi:beta-aspartyl-peptidase (threonine type)